MLPEHRYVVEKFLRRLATDLAAELRRIGVAKSLIDWIVPRFNVHLRIALVNVINALPAAKEHPGFRAVVYWLHERIEGDKR